MRDIWTLGPLLALLLVTLFSDFSQSAIIVKNRVPAKFQNVKIPLNEKENMTMELFEEAVEDYVDLSNAFHSPAESEAIREKRTLTLFRTIANRTRSGIKTLRSLFSGGRSGDSGDSSSGTGFRTFFSNLLNRILTFLTTLWDRITAVFRSGGSEGNSSSSGLFSRIRTGAAGLVSRFTGSGSSGFLANLLSPKTTAVPDYSDSNSESESSSEAPLSSSKLPLVEAEEIAQEEKVKEEKVEGGYGYSGNVVLDPVSEYLDTAAAPSNVYRVRGFIPFPMDSDPNFHLRGVQSEPAYSNPWSHSISRRQSENYPSTRHIFYSY